MLRRAPLLPVVFEHLVGFGEHWDDAGGAVAPLHQSGHRKKGGDATGGGGDLRKRMP